MWKSLYFGFVPALLIAFAPLLLAAADQQPTFTDPAQAGPDYAVQGEYLGTVQDAGPQTWGAQVVALGDGKFDLVGYHGGLPGEGWKRGDERIRASGQTADGVTNFKSDDWTATIKNGALTVLREGQSIGTLKQVQRQSSTSGAKPPPGAVVLFDGSQADEFDKGKLTEGQLLAADCSSKKKFGEHVLHIEFRTPFCPFARGQGRGNSGVYLQSRYEVQVLDSFGLEGENNECGGIYTIGKPLVNMCFPPLTWQTYDCEFTAARYDQQGNKVSPARVTVKHNGVLIHDNLELPKGTPGRHAEGPGPDALYLQGHGNPVVYRNIWVVEK
ncbi:MAG: DUF1080 domain-containing protein [Planctomycetota bacterium]|nr:DUF1080 domain-containing protein [Planctomycetota bacterium]